MGAPAWAASSYFVQSSDETDAGSTSHIAFVRVATESELAGFDAAASGVAVEGDAPALFFGTAAFRPVSGAPAIQRFDALATGAVIAGPQLDLASFGVTDVPYWRINVVSLSRAYFFDSEHDRAIVWDPSTMQVTGEIAIAAGAKPGFTRDPLASFGKVVGSRLIVPINWYDDDGHSLSTTAAYVVDTETNQFLGFSEDTRCPGYVISLLPSGDAHFFADDFLVQEVFGNAATPVAPCSLRIRAGESTFDPDFLTDLSSLVGGSVAAPIAVQGGLPDGQGGFYLGAFDPERFAQGDAAYYRLFHWQVGSASATPVEAVDFWTGSMPEYSVALEPVYSLQPSPVAGSTSVLNFSDGPLSSVDLAGNVVAFARVSSDPVVPVVGEAGE